MKVAKRVAGEYAIQLIGFAVTLADRLLIAAVLLRYWGVSNFALWSVLGAAAGLLAVFDVGVNAYFVNRVMIHVQRGEAEMARRAQRNGNAITFLTSFVGVLIVLAGFGTYAHHTGNVALSGWVWGIVACLTLSTWLRMAIGVQSAVYRAHNEFGRGCLWLFGMDTLRIAGTIGLAAVGVGLLAVAICQLAIVAAVATLIALWDTGRRYPGFGFGMAVMPRSERREMMLVAVGYWIQGAPNAVITFAPVMYLGAVGVASVIVAQFVLMRTIGNLVRQVLQMFALVLGQEAARRYARGETVQLAASYRESVRLLAVQTACAAGALIALGAPLFTLWTGHAGMFDRAMLILAVLPPVLVPSGTLMQAFLGSINRPYPLAAARTAQVLLTALALALLPIDNEGRRLMAAIGLGEVIGFALPISVIASRRLIADAGVAQMLDGVMRAAVVGIVTYLAAAETMAVCRAQPLVGTLLGILAAGAILIGSTLLLGMSRHRLPAIWQAGRRLLSAAR